MRVAIVYAYAGAISNRYQNYAARFIESYNSNPPGIDHDSVVVVNGSKSDCELTCMFSPLQNCTFLNHDNSGYDIGAFQLAARTIPCDMIVFLGSSTWFNRKGWLARMVRAFERCGNAQYGAMGNRGNLAVRVWPHIRTTAFWMRPELMNAYPHVIRSPEQRHPFEHGEHCFTNWVTNQGLKSLVVTWTNILEWQNWDDDANGFQRGNQTSLLAGDHLCERPYYPHSKCRSMPTRDCAPWAQNSCWKCLTSPSQ